MRWGLETHQAGETRLHSGFLFWPKRIGRETRWLEWAHWSEIWDTGSGGGWRLNAWENA